MFDIHFKSKHNVTWEVVYNLNLSINDLQCPEILIAVSRCILYGIQNIYWLHHENLPIEL